MSIQSFIWRRASFFVTTNGLFVTARYVLHHVLDSKGQQTEPIGLFQLLDQDGNYVERPILSSVSHKNRGRLRLRRRRCSDYLEK